MRPQLHRAALVRFAVRVSVVGAVCAGASAVLLPSVGAAAASSGWQATAAAGAGGIAVGLRWLSEKRRPRPRVTAPRAVRMG